VEIFKSKPSTEIELKFKSLETNLPILDGDKYKFLKKISVSFL